MEPEQGQDEQDKYLDRARVIIAVTGRVGQNESGSLEYR